MGDLLNALFLSFCFYDERKIRQGDCIEEIDLQNSASCAT
jgi:hypothetical protein